MGTIIFYLLWPFVWFYVPLFVRGRAVIIVGDEILVVKNWFGPGVWQLPGGGMKFGESPLQAINRELKEELGLTYKDGKMLTSEPVIFRKRGLLLRQHYALYELDSKPEVTLSRELTDHSWQLVNESPLPEPVRQLIKQ